MTELDALRAQIACQRAQARPEDPVAAATASRAQQEAEHSARESRQFEEASNRAAHEGAAPFRPTQDVKRMFRQLAQKIHPDRAIDDADRAWRTQLMSEANRAYRAGHLEGLEEVAALWQEGRRQPAAAPAAKPAASTLAIQVERMRRRLGEIQDELHRLFGSKLYELFVAARQALRLGRDLLQEMADALDRQLQSARSELGAN